MNVLGTEAMNTAQGITYPEPYVPVEDDFFIDDAQRSLAIPHYVVNKFVTEEFDWPILNADLFKRKCGEIGSRSVNVKGTTYARADVTREVLRLLASVPFVDPDNELVVTGFARSLGLRGYPGLTPYLEQDQFRHFVRLRRRGNLPESYKITPAITVEGATNLALHIAATRKARPIVKSAAKLVASTQENYHKGRGVDVSPAKLGFVAIDRFMTGVTEDAANSGNHFVGLPPPAYQSSPDGAKGEQPITIDESHDLSLYGMNWRKHAACKDADPDLFMSTNTKQVEQALSMCDRCRVKGDCLLSTLDLLAQQNSPPEGTAGGTVQTGRDALSYREVKELMRQLEHTRPSAAHARPGLRRLVKMCQYDY